MVLTYVSVRRLFAQVLPVLLPDIQKAPTKDRKIIAVGLANLLARSNSMLNPPSVQAWCGSPPYSPPFLSLADSRLAPPLRTPTMTALLKLFLLPLPLAKNTSGVDDEVDVADPEDTGYQASFSKLGASERARPDPVAHVAEPRTYLATSLVAASQAHPGKVSQGVACCVSVLSADSFCSARQIRPLVEAVGPEFAGPFLTYLAQNGFELQ